MEYFAKRQSLCVAFYFFFFFPLTSSLNAALALKTGALDAAMIFGVYLCALRVL